MGTYQEGCDGAEEESVKPSQVSIGKKSSGDGSEIGGATPDVDHISRSHVVQIVHRVQIQYQIRHQTHRRQFLKRLICYYTIINQKPNHKPNKNKTQQI